MQTILVLTNMYPTAHNPMKGIFVQRICSGLEQGDIFKTKVVAPRAKYKVLAYSMFYLRALFSLFFQKYDYVYCHFISHTGVLGVIARRLLKKKVVLHCHGTDVLHPYTQQNWVHRLNYYALKSAHKVVVPSQFFKTTIEHAFPQLESHKVVISPSGGVFVPKTMPQKVPHEMLHIGFVSNQTAMKGRDILIKALQELNIDCVVHVAGAGETQPYDAIQNPRVQIKKYGILSTAKLQDLFTKLDLLVFPTLYEESLGLSPIEAMAFATPVIASATTVSAEYMQHGHNGFVIPKGSSEALISAITTYLALSQEQKSDMQQAAYHSSQAYERHHVAKQLQHVLLDM